MRVSVHRSVMTWQTLPAADSTSLSPVPGPGYPPSPRPSPAGGSPSVQASLGPLSSLARDWTGPAEHVTSSGQWDGKGGVRGSGGSGKGSLDTARSAPDAWAAVAVLDGVRMKPRQEVEPREWQRSRARPRTSGPRAYPTCGLLVMWGTQSLSHLRRLGVGYSATCSQRIPGETAMTEAAWPEKGNSQAVAGTGPTCSCDSSSLCCSFFSAQRTWLARFSSSSCKAWNGVR